MQDGILLVQSLQTFGEELGHFLPKIILAMVVLVVGWLFAKLLRYLTGKLFQFTKLNVAAQRAGFDEFLLRGGIGHTTAGLTGQIIYWLAILMAILAMLNVLGLEASAELFNRVLLYVPNVVVAVIILVIGALIARFSQSISQAYFNNIGLHGARTMSLVAQYSILGFTIFIALEHLSIAGAIIISAFQIAFAGLCLAFGLAFGLGGRDAASRLIGRFFN